SMYGKTGVRIMINGKASRVPADAVNQMLDGMSAANIASIELITSPSSDFDAEGNGGIINIVLKENLAQGTNGNLGFTLGYNQAETLGANFNLNHRAKKVNLFLDYTIHYDKYEVPWDNSRFIRTPTFEKKSISLSDRVPKKTVQNLRAGIEYLITPDFTLNALVTGYRRGWDMNAVTTIENVNHPDTTINTLMQLHEDHIWDGWTGNLGFDYKWNDVHKLVVNYDYLFYKNTNPSNYDVSSTLNTDQFISQEKIDVSKLTPIHFNVLSADYTHKLKPSLKIKAGLKGTLSKFNNDVLVRTLQKETWRVDPTFTNESELEEQILAGYTAVEWEQSEDLQISAGLRYEYTDSYLSTPDQKGLIDRQFGNFFPSFRLSKRWAENQKIQFAYSKRITRPNFNDMAPFVFFIGPNTFVAGNPALRPAVSNGLDLSYNYKRWWLSLKYSYTENSIGFLQPEIDEAINQQILRSQNLDFLRTWSFSNSLPIDLNNWWELQTDLSVYHHTFKTSNFTENFQDDVLSFDLNLISTISLPKKHTLEMTANYQSRTLWGIWQFNPMFMVNIGGSKKLKNGTLSLNIADVFNTWTWSLETQLRENNTAVFSESDIDARAITIGYTHNFGNRKLEKVDIQLKSEEERKRVN
ncbi:MAG: outer membrane beta-barrel family protein, partial [Bacteroidota bacterium]